MRFGWTTKVSNNGPELTLTDTEILITDKDNAVHRCLIKGDWDDWGLSNTPYAIDSNSRAESYIERNEYITTEEGKRIPRCNIKHVTFNKINERKVQPTTTSLGIKDWTSTEWSFFFCVVLPFVILPSLLFTALIVFAAYKKITG